MSQPIYRPPNKRRMQLEAWVVFLSFVVFTWCLVGGVYLGAKVMWALVRWLGL